MNIKDFLVSVEMFKSCSDEFLERIIAICETKTYQEKEMIFEEGSCGEKFYIIVSGEVGVIKNYGKQNQKLLSTLKEKDIFGELALFGSIRRTATAIVNRESRIVLVNAKMFREIFLKFPSEGLKVVEWLLLNMGLRLEQTSKELSTVYTISKFISGCVNEENMVKKFVSDVCMELNSSISERQSIGIYLYNMFTEEFELGGSAGERRGLLRESFDKKDKLVSIFLSGQREGVYESGVEKYLCYSLEYNSNLLGFILIGGEKLPDQRTKDLIVSVANIVEMAVDSFNKLEEELQLKKFRERKNRFELI